jgi:two-component system, probable response regulator PhcQ
MTITQDRSLRPSNKILTMDEGQSAMENNLETVLIVDDNAHVLNSLCRALSEEPYRVITASSAAEGLKILGQEDIALLITDHRMPGMTGLELLWLTQHLHPETLTVLLTGHADLDLTIELINRTSVYRILLKPWQETELKTTIRSALQLKKTLEQQTGSVGPERTATVTEALERAFPGITRVDTDHEGCITLTDALAPDEIRALLRESS